MLPDLRSLAAAQSTICETRSRTESRSDARTARDLERATTAVFSTVSTTFAAIETSRTRRSARSSLREDASSRLADSPARTDGNLPADLSQQENENILTRFQSSSKEDTLSKDINLRFPTEYLSTSRHAPRAHINTRSGFFEVAHREAGCWLPCVRGDATSILRGCPWGEF